MVEGVTGVRGYSFPISKYHSTYTDADPISASMDFRYGSEHRA